MSRLLCLVVLWFVAACGADPKPDEPKTAREKQRREATANTTPSEDGKNKHWGKWRYKGTRDACFFVVGASCFKTENAACQSARCKKPKKCTVVGAGPATVSCK